MNSLPKSLIERYQDDRIIPFIGAGVSMSIKKASDGTRLFPSWLAFLKACQEVLVEERIKGYTKVVEGELEKAKPNYYRAASEARDGLGPLWYNVLKEHFNILKKAAEPKSLELAQAIWNLKSKLVITTNFDRVLEWTCPEKDDLAIWNIEAKKEFNDYLNEGLYRPTIWYLHGRIDDATNLIITPDGYEKLYPTSDNSNTTKKKYDAALETFKNILISKSLLFIGFSMDDTYIKNQIKAISEIFKYANGPHYILVREANENMMQERLGNNSNLKIITFKDFGQPLVDVINQLSKYPITKKKR